MHADLPNRVLYLEDNPLDADLLRRALARQAPQIALDIVSTLAAARERLAPAAPDYELVLADLRLSDGDGMQLLAHVRERRLPVAVVILTGSGDQDSAVAALKAGADDYVAKRADYSNRLIPTLAAALARFRSEFANRARVLRVLYAEHNAYDNDLARRHFARHAPHIRLDIVDNGLAVLDALPQTVRDAPPYDVILLDYQLPGINALEIAKILRDERSLDLPVVLVTGHGSEDVVAEALRLGVADYLVKHAGYLAELPAIVEHAHRQAQLMRERAKLRESDRRKDEFLATLAHELRNPLAPMRTAAEILRVAHGNAALTAQSVTILQRQLSHMVRLIDDLLDISRIKEGKLKLRRQILDLREAVRNAEETSRPLVDAGQLGLKIALPDQPVLVEGDLVRLSQVLSNLLNNSARFTPPGGAVELRLERAAGEAVVRVIDTGIGIEPEALPTLFDMFSQVERHTDNTHGGLGIGLTLVRALVEQHDGQVSGYSAGRGKGATFTVRLPLARAGMDVADVAAEPPGTAARLRVLVADDNVDAANCLGTLLNIIGQDVRVVYDGDEAVLQAQKFHPQVVFMDIGMPRLDGLEATRRIRAAGLTDARIYTLSGRDREIDRQKSRAAGCDRHLVKPLELQVLERLLLEAERAETR